MTSYLDVLKNEILQQNLRELSDRLELVESKVNKTAKKEQTTKGQQILLLFHLGLLDKLNELALNATQKARLLSVLLNVSQENIRKDLSEVYKPKSQLTHEMNYNFLVDLFGELKLDKLEAVAQEKLNMIHDDKEKVKS